MIDRTSPENFDTLAPNEVLVFPSNRSGAHGAGLAKLAVKHGAEYGVGFGERGQTFAIPTKGWKPDGLPILKIHDGTDGIAHFVKIFVEWAKLHPEKTYIVSKIGCGLAGYTPEEIAPLFVDAIEVSNIHLPKAFWGVLNKECNVLSNRR